MVKETYLFVVFIVTLSKSGKNGQKYKLKMVKIPLKTKQRHKIDSRILFEKNNIRPHPKRNFIFLYITLDFVHILFDFNSFYIFIIPKKGKYNKNFNLISNKLFF